MENWQYLFILNLSITYKPAIQLLVIYSTETCTYFNQSAWTENVYIIAAIFVIAPKL